MQVSFNTPLTDVDGNALSVTALAAASYTLYLDTVNPPVKSYLVPAANLQAATTNPDGSKRVVIDAVKDLGLKLTPGTKYYVGATDTVSGTSSDETPILTYTYTPKPNPPGQVQVS